MKDARLGAIVLAAVVGLYLVVVLGGRLRINRHLDLSSNRTERAIFPAQLPGFVVRRAGESLRSSVGDTSELFGRVVLSSSGIEWQPTARSTRLGAVPMKWSPQDARRVTVTSVGKMIPMCLLYVEDSRGEADLWVRRPASFVRQRLADFGLPGASNPH
jgi:hypothetical protein